MGSGLARNLINNGFATTGFDLSAERMKAFTDIGGTAANSVADVGAQADHVFVMVMNGDQAKSVILGGGDGDEDEGLLANMAKDGTILLTATIKPSEARTIGEAMTGSGINLIDSPVSGGFPGAQGGTLTMMAAGSDEAMATNRDVMEAVSATIHHVGQQAGDGQTVKACLQLLIGSIFSATFEAAALAAKAGVSGEVLYKWKYSRVGKEKQGVLLRTGIFTPWISVRSFQLQSKILVLYDKNHDRRLKCEDLKQKQWLVTVMVG